MTSSGCTIALPDHIVEIRQTSRTGDPVVLVHGGILDQEMWTSLIDKLPGRRFITYDLRGHGTASAAPPIRGIDELASDLGVLLNQAKLGRCHFVGVSLGGAVVQQFAAKHAERVRSLVVVASACEFPSGTMRSRAESLATAGRAATLEETLVRWFTTSALGRNASYVKYARDCLGRVTEQNWWSAFNALAEFRLHAGARRLAAPVLAVAGSADRSTPPEVVRRVAELYQAGSYAEIDGAPHMVPLECPDALAVHLDEFLQKAEAQIPKPDSGAV